MNDTDRWVGRLSIVGASGNPPERLLPVILRTSRRERTLAVLSRNLGLPCEAERQILARQIRAAHQWKELRGRFEAIPLKGLDLAHRLYPSPGLRDMGDLDLLVRRQEIREADGALRALGYAPGHDPDRLASASGETLNAVEYARDGDLPVHLHWHVSNASLPHFMYRIDMDEIWSERRGGVLAPHHQVVTLCEHALKHSFSELILLTDVELAARTADAREVAGTARRWGLERAVYFAASLLRSLTGAASPALGGVRVEPGWLDHAFLRWARRRRWNGLSAVGFLAMAKGLREKAKFLSQAFAPGERDALRSRSVFGRLRRAVEMVTST